MFSIVSRLEEKMKESLPIQSLLSLGLRIRRTVFTPRNVITMQIQSISNNILNIDPPPVLNNNKKVRRNNWRRIKGMVEVVLKHFF